MQLKQTNIIKPDNRCCIRGLSSLGQPSAQFFFRRSQAFAVDDFSGNRAGDGTRAFVEHNVLMVLIKGLDIKFAV